VLAALAERTAVSAGLAVFPRDGVTADSLHSVADAHMYVHKRQRTAVDGTGQPSYPSERPFPARN